MCAERKATALNSGKPGHKSCNTPTVSHWHTASIRTQRGKPKTARTSHLRLHSLLQPVGRSARAILQWAFPPVPLAVPARTTIVPSRPVKHYTRTAQG